MSILSGTELDLNICHLSLYFFGVVETNGIDY